MEMRAIGKLQVSTVGLGCNNFGRRLDAAASARVIDAALDAGINFLDTADVYGGSNSEVYIGQALAGKRSRVILATKFGMELDEQRKGAHPDYVRRAVEDSLRRLATDYIDLYQLHTPDDDVPIADTLCALAELVAAGKVREIGCSNFSADQLREAQACSSGLAVRFVSVQNHYSMAHREPEAEVLPECARQGLALLPFFPLASGLLSGKYGNNVVPPKGTRMAESDYFAKWLSEENLRRVDALSTFASARGHSILELAFAYLLARPEVASVIAGATSPEQVGANAAAATWRLGAEDMVEVAGLLKDWEL